MPKRALWVAGKGEFEQPEADRAGIYVTSRDQLVNLLGERVNRGLGEFNVAHQLVPIDPNIDSPADWRLRIQVHPEDHGVALELGEYPTARADLVAGAGPPFLPRTKGAPCAAWIGRSARPWSAAAPPLPAPGWRTAGPGNRLSKADAARSQCSVSSALPLCPLIFGALVRSAASSSCMSPRAQGNPLPGRSGKIRSRRNRHSVPASLVSAPGSRRAPAPAPQARDRGGPEPRAIVQFR
jgi:hypothetical protein